jgi:hypothetical protein
MHGVNIPNTSVNDSKRTLFINCQNNKFTIHHIEIRRFIQMLPFERYNKLSDKVFNNT